MIGYGVSFAGTMVVAVGLFLLLRRPPRPLPGNGTTRGPPARETLFTQGRLTLRARPESDAPVVRRLDPSVPVEVVPIEGSPWVRVSDVSGTTAFAFRSRATLLPVRPRLPAPPDTTALCTDSTSSFSQHSPGTCSHHGGVLCWIDDPGGAPTRHEKQYCKYSLSPQLGQP